MFSRTEYVIGKENLEKIKKSKITILGVGGVGGYIVEMFARLGVGSLTIIDCDKFDDSNLNRQIGALHSTIGKQKVEVIKKRILDINPQCEVFEKNQKIQKNNIQEILSNDCDYVVDAIDDVAAKIEVIKHCKKKNIPLICAMGTGNRYKMPDFEVSDISKTSYDKLAKKIRKILSENEIYHQDVVYTKEPAEKTTSLGSVVYYPLMCAGKIVSFVINKLIEK